MKKFITAFKEFISKGNVLDMAVGVIIATAFGKITTAMVNNVLMPVIGYVFGGSDAAAVLNITLKPAVLDAAGEVVTPATVLGLGTLLNAILDFVIIAFICFLIVRSFNKARELADRKKKAAEAEAAAKAAAEAEAAAAAKATELSREEQLLTEIRDLLKSRSAR